MFDPWVGKIPWRREWLPTPVFLPGEFYGQRNLAGYSPWSRIELDRSEQLTLSLDVQNLSHSLRLFGFFYFHNALKMWKPLSAHGL